MARIFIGALVAGGLLWGVYYLVNNSDAPVVGMNPTKLREFHYAAADLWDKIKTTGSSAGNFAARESRIAKDKLTESFGKIALRGSALADKGETTALERIKNFTDSAFNSTVDNLRNYLDIATSTANRKNDLAAGELKNNPDDSSPLQFFKTVIKRKQEVTLSASDILFRKNNNRDITYFADWGDGRRESGIFYYEGNRLVSHIFSNAGEYSALFTFSINQNKIDYTVPLIVIE